jgi:hypothetical protein
MIQTYVCDKCGQEVSGSHYHCSCGSLDVTGAYGHHKAYHLINGKMVSTDFHHCDWKNGNCELDTRRLP